MPLQSQDNRKNFAFIQPLFSALQRNEQRQTAGFSDSWYGMVLVRQVSKAVMAT